MAAKIQLFCQLAEYIYLCTATAKFEVLQNHPTPTHATYKCGVCQGRKPPIGAGEADPPLVGDAKSRKRGHRNQSNIK